MRRFGKEKMQDKHFEMLDNQRLMDSLSNRENVKFDTVNFWKSHKEKARIFGGAINA
ncbi:hypothetical protein [Enterococcus faecalis]|uniref:hypothetical protein n=1 Tax=Enterococcus faecalis TaxID=1351 RepID=UPI0034CDE741